MSKEKQIEKMAKIIARRSVAFRNPNIAFMPTATKTAESLYNAGYRKQSEGEWIITNNRDLEIIRECSNCHSKTYFPYNPIMHCRKPQYCEDCGAKMKGKDGEGE